MGTERLVENQLSLNHDRIEGSRRDRDRLRASEIGGESIGYGDGLTVDAKARSSFRADAAVRPDPRRPGNENRRFVNYAIAPAVLGGPKLRRAAAEPRRLKISCFC